MSEPTQNTPKEKTSTFQKISFFFTLIWQISAISTLAHKTYADERLTAVNSILLLLTVAYFFFTVYAFWKGTQKQLNGKVKRTYKRCKNLGKLYSWCVMLYIWFTARNLSFIAIILIVIMSIAFLIGLVLDLLLSFIINLFTGKKTKN